MGTLFLVFVAAMAVLVYLLPYETPTLQFVIRDNNQTFKVNQMTTTIFSNHAPVTMTVEFKTAAGVVGVPDQLPVWVSSDASVLTVDAAVDGMSAIATLTGTGGAATVTVTADGVSATADFVISTVAEPVATAEITVEI